MRSTSTLVLIAASAAVASDTTHEQQCEMCGILVWRLEAVLASKKVELQSFRDAQDKRASSASKPHSKRWLRQEYPAVVVTALNEYLEKACDNDFALANTACRQQNGNDESALRNPRGAAFNRDACADRVKHRCERVRDELMDEMIDAAMQNLTASECTELLPGCDDERVHLLLGPMYKKGKLMWGSAGMKDTWQKMPGLPPYYFNAARHISQVEMPKGWDKKGPREQTIETFAEEEGAAGAEATKDEV